MNNGPDAQYLHAAIQASGQSRNADMCYWPTGNPTALNWGSSRNCDAQCPNGVPAGKFVAITLEQPYKPLFLTATAVVRTQ